jgi:hypothetical protein
MPDSRCAEKILVNPFFFRQLRTKNGKKLNSLSEPNLRGLPIGCHMTMPISVFGWVFLTFLKNCAIFIWRIIVNNISLALIFSTVIAAVDPH